MITRTWTNGKPFVATAEDCAFKWACRKPGEAFRCFSCGHKFVVGDTVRWQFTNDTPGAGGNPFVCRACDDGRDEIIKEIKKRRAELKKAHWWWFLPKDKP